MEKIIVETLVNASPDRAWFCYTSPEEMVHWNFASPDWHCPAARVDLRVGGGFHSRMEAKDGSMGFDFDGVYTRLEKGTLLEYRFGDRSCLVEFLAKDGGTFVRVSFDPETENPVELQRGGWQAILENFRLRAEAAA